MTRTYGSLIRDLGLTPCHGIGPTGHYCGLTRDQHIMGGVDRSDTTVIHWLDVPLGKWPDVKRFLVVCARALDPTLMDNDPVWRQVYRGNVAARAVGRRLGIRVPARYLKFDRMVVLSGVAGLSNDVPFRKQAFDWSRR
jgi:hypothetical protein